MARTVRERCWAAYMIAGKRAVRLGDVVAADRDAAIARAIEEFNITDQERKKRVAVRPIEARRSGR